MLFDMLIQGKHDAFLRNIANKHCIIVILTVLKKPRCNVFHLYDDADIDIKNLDVQSFLKCLINKIR